MVVAPGDVGVLAEAIRYLLENGARRREMGAAGRKRVEKHFTSERMAAGLMEVYRAVVGERAGEEIWQGVPAKRPRSEEAVAAGEKYASG
jgi:spore maturation protein CgeB